MKRIEPVKEPLRGEITVPGDKSIAHRAVILASVARGRSRIFNLSGGDDNSRTVKAFRQMGVEIFRDGDALCVEGKGWEGIPQWKQRMTMPSVGGPSSSQSDLGVLQRFQFLRSDQISLAIFFEGRTKKGFLPHKRKVKKCILCVFSIQCFPVLL